MPLSLHVGEQECATTGRKTHLNEKNDILNMAKQIQRRILNKN